MARSIHDPVYVLGWLGFIGLVAVIVLAYQEKPLPGLLGGLVGSAFTVLGQAAKSYIERDKEDL